MPITRSDGFVVQTGDPDPEGNVHDFFPPGSDTVRRKGKLLLLLWQL